MKKLLLFIAIALVSCGDPELVPNKLFGTKWERFALHSPVNNKDMYYYLLFVDNTTVKSYLLYDKVERTEIDDTGTYTIDGDNITLTINGHISTGIIEPDKITTKNHLGVVGIYKKVY